MGGFAGKLKSLRLFAAVLIVVLAAGFSTESRAANWFEKNFWLSGPRYDAVVPLCEDSWVLGKIQSRFAEKEGRFWNSALQISAFSDVSEISFRPGHYAAIPRRFCRGHVIVNDGTRHRINYSIGEDTGIIGTTWGVEWCVVGLDRNWAYNPACKAALP